MLRLVILLLGGVFIAACNQEREEIVIRIDLSHERDEGRYTPESGDRVTLVGDFNEWEPGGIEFKDENWDWIAQATIPKEWYADSDTLRFKFVIVSKQNRDLPNSGWEVIPNRVITIDQLKKKQPLFLFNEQWHPGEVKDVEFAVSMSNQQVLGFFDPAEDKIVVSGSFLEWDPTGIVLEDPDVDMIYEVTMPVKVIPNKRVSYKYRIVKPAEKSRGYLPFDGWEQVDNRLIDIEENFDSTQVDYFNNQMRVARFIISEEWLIDSAGVSLNKGDLLQIRLDLIDKEFVTDPLIKTNKGTYETSIEVPLNIMNVQWEILKNYDPINFKSQELFLDHKGKVIRL